MELIQKTISIATLVFVLSSMLATGLGLTVSEIITPLRNTRLVVLSLLANFVLMPLAAVGLASLLRLDQPLGVGLRGGSLHLFVCFDLIAAQRGLEDHPLHAVAA